MALPPKTGLPRIVLGLVCTALIAFPTLSAAQSSVQLGERLRDALREAAERELRERLGDDEQDTDNPDGQQSDGADADRPTSNDAINIDFENVNGPIAGAPTNLSDQYRKSYGLTFGDGASVVSCPGPTSAVQLAACPYPRAASGTRVAYHDVRASGQAMELFFDNPVSNLTVKINPTGGEIDQEFIARITGFDESGKQLATLDTRFFWYQDAFTWPTQAGLWSDGQRMSKATIELRPVGGRSPVRFLIDNLSFTPAPDATEPVITPVFTDLTEQETREPIAAIDDRYSSASTGNDRRGLELYPAATRVRVKVDWDAAFTARDEQDSQGISSAAIANNADLSRAALPLLLPQNADAAIDLAVDNAGDSYSAVFEKDGRQFDYYGTRVLTVVQPDSGAGGGAPNLKYIELEYGLAASFSLYGVSYRVTQYCTNDNADEEATCYDRGKLKERVQDLVVVIGATGETRP